ncbi:hypothetical protein [Verrucosispora sp. WMMC514]|uniref:hypothetical protein n=1 Tax=Verrucosispora sp. WMMC514 TaxID=3015156 RepID=UPI00248A90BE|nr:hypothetical protein [Verrucosispora sp. WMMC514]WBB93691.1 hypothetical protein O7597_12310 [Verrucosispora sp. WMMC514]
MQIDVTRWLSLVTRDAVASATATVGTTGPDGTVQHLSEHRLAASGLLRWSYTVSDADGEVHRRCDGRHLVQVSGDGEQLSSPVPEEDSRDDPRYFYSWPAVVDAWLVEMLRPVDLLSRVVVSAVTEPDATGLVHIDASPLGNEPSPYHGFALPDRRTLRIVLDPERGCLVAVTVSRVDRPPLTCRLTELV